MTGARIGLKQFMNKKIKVIVAGALGKMGKMAIDTFLDNKDKFELKAGIVRNLKEIDAKSLKYFEEKGVILSDNLEAEFHKGDIDVLVELTTPDSVFKNSKIALDNGVRPVIGATGLSDEDILELNKKSLKANTGAIIAPNFAIGAILMMKFAAEAVKYMNRYEIIERHHENKLDSPSGTAIKTAKLMSENAIGVNHASFKDQKARGELYYDIPIHSLRLQGYVASQEVIFGGLGQTLTLKHDTIDRSSFMPGILLASEKVMELDRLIYGLENIV
jgi:4-hydroxy-tetrahydrodipicolinate reductase